MRRFFSSWLSPAERRNPEVGGRILVIAVPSVGTYPFCKAASTSAFAGPSRSFSSRMIAASCTSL